MATSSLTDNPNGLTVSERGASSDRIKVIEMAVYAALGCTELKVRNFPDAAKQIATFVEGALIDADHRTQSLLDNIFGQTALVAQRTEQPTSNRQVGGSIPPECATLEQFAAFVRQRHGLSSLHIFTSDMPGVEWRIFAARINPKGIEASVESGGGATLMDAIKSIDERLTAGPINKPYVPFLDPQPKGDRTASTTKAAGA